VVCGSTVLRGSFGPSVDSRPISSPARSSGVFNYFPAMGLVIFADLWCGGTVHVLAAPEKWTSTVMLEDVTMR